LACAHGFESVRAQVLDLAPRPGAFDGAAAGVVEMEKQVPARLFGVPTAFEGGCDEFSTYMAYIDIDVGVGGESCLPLR
jgi:hypothetical protein